jgi:hypothetical protein
MPAGGQDEIRFEREVQKRNEEYQQQQGQHAPNSGQVAPPGPPPQDAEHKKGARPSTWERHSGSRPGDKKPPNYVPYREYKEPKERKSNQPKPPKVPRNKYKKEEENGSS